MTLLGESDKAKQITHTQLKTHKGLRILFITQNDINHSQYVEANTFRPAKN